MQIFVGVDNKILSLDVNADINILNLKQSIYNITNTKTNSCSY